ncbi:MAG: bifunctional helix-turn-helix transcriptional regulator/GNAT family N-acetyltransferase [Devosia sp.]
MAVRAEDIAQVRAFNRFYTKVIGLLTDGMHDSPFNLAEARIIYELGSRGVTTAASELARDLGMDPGQLSRLVRRLDKYGLLSITPNHNDRRVNDLVLTPRGEAVYQGFDGASTGAIAKLLEPLGAFEQRDLLSSMRRIQAMLAEPDKDPLILRPHRVGEIGWLIHRQGLLYHLEQGWNGEFEMLITKLYGEFVAAPPTPPKALWIAEQAGEVAGSVYILPAAASEGEGTAQLRMLYVEPAFRGQGVGRRLVEEAVRFSREAGYQRVILWTQDCLVGARHIYQNAGFTLVREDRHQSFGVQLNGQYWAMTL